MNCDADKHLCTYKKKIMNVNYSDTIFAIYQCENDSCEFVYMTANYTGEQMGLSGSTHYASELEKLLDKLETK